MSFADNRPHASEYPELHASGRLDRWSVVRYHQEDEGEVTKPLRLRVKGLGFRPTPKE